MQILEQLLYHCFQEAIAQVGGGRSHPGRVDDAVPQRRREGLAESPRDHGREEPLRPRDDAEQRVGGAHRPQERSHSGDAEGGPGEAEGRIPLDPFGSPAGGRAHEAECWGLSSLDHGGGSLPGPG